MTVLTLAQDQLFSRAPEDHFGSFEALRADASTQKGRCSTLDAKDDRILFSDDGAHVHFGDATLRLTHYAFGQLAAMARVPMPVLERLDGDTRSKVMNRCFPRNRRYRTALVDGDRLRCVTSDRYERVFDADVYEQIDRWLLPNGFIPAMPTINTDNRGTNLLGNTKPALFRSDRDSFAFFYGDRAPGDDGFGGLRKGVVVYNSEVGAKSFGFSTFFFRDMCSNFLIWDATGVRARRARHTGAIVGVVREFREELQEIGAVLTTRELDAFETARTTRFVPEGSGERDAAIKRLVRDFRLPEADAMEVADLVRAPENPGAFTVWGVVNGITSAAKALAYADDRADLSAVAGSVLSSALTNR
jgi:hypothetical protein